MKKILLLVFILVLGKISYSQYPLQQNLGSDSTIVVSKGALQSRLAPIVISDTTAANNQRIKNYPGAQLYTANGDFYVRNATATKWILVSSGSSGPINIYNSDGTLTGNRVLTGAGNSILFNGVSGFGVNKAPDSSFTVEGGLHATGGLRLDNLASSPGTKTLRIDGQGVVSVADTTVSGGTVTSVGLTMPTAFNVSGSPITSAGTLSVTAAGVASQYIRGDGQLATLPTTGGGGSSVSYYLNGSVNQGTFGGNTYYQMNKTPVLGAGTDFTISSNGYIASFITDAGDPDLLNIPAGNWDFEIYFQSSSSSGTPSFYVELYKYNGTTFTLIASSSTNPKFITSGTTVDAYYTPLPVPATTLAITDRLAIRVYVNNSGNTITLHTEDNNLCQVITTFSTGINALNGLTDQVQYFAVGTSGTDFNISSLTDTHTFNLPTASATNRGALSTIDWTTFNSKISPSDTASMLAPYLRKADTTAMLANYVNNVGYGLSKAGQVVSADSATLANYFLRRKDSLTSTNLLGYVTRTILADTAAAIRSADAGGTVTSIATNNGTGITGGTITTTGTLAIDTLLISTRAWRQKGVDSVAALVNSNVSGTTNRVSKFTGANTIGNSSIADSSSSVAMTILSSGNIGINTSAPNEKLETVGVSRITKTTSPSVYLNIGMENNTAEYDARGSIDQVWKTQALERMRLTLGGNLGVGTVSPDSMLTVNEGARFLRGVRMSGLPTAVGTKALRIDANGTLSIADTTTGGGIGGSGTTNRLAKFTASGTIGNSSIADSSSSVAMTISSGGNVLVGSTTATNNLRLNESFAIVKTGNATYGGMSISNYNGTNFNTRPLIDINRSRGTTDGSMTAVANGDFLGTVLFRGADGTGFLDAAFINGEVDGVVSTNDMPGRLTFWTTPDGTSAATEKMRITNGGNVGINTTTIGSRLQVNGNAAIGYSASTAAPTNGLAVSGNVGIGLSSPSTQLHIRTATVTGFSADAAYDKFIVENGNSSQGANIQLVSNSTNGVSEIGFSDATRNVGLISYGHSTNNMNFSTSSTTRFTITSGGQVTLATGANVSAIAQTGYSLTGSNAQSLIDLAGTWNTTGNPTAIKLNITNTASGATANLMDLQVGGTSEFKVTKAGYVGINEGTPTSFLHVGGSVAAKYVSKTATYTLDSTDYTVVFNISSAVTANLPDATTCTGRIYVIKVNNTTNTDSLTIDPNGAQTIDGNATYAIQCQYGIMIQSDGANWRIIADFGLGLNCL